MAPQKTKLNTQDNLKELMRQMNEIGERQLMLETLLRMLLLSMQRDDSNGYKHVHMELDYDHTDMPDEPKHNSKKVGWIKWAGEILKAFLKTLMG